MTTAPLSRYADAAPESETPTATLSPSAPAGGAPSAPAEAPAAAAFPLEPRPEGAPGVKRLNHRHEGVLRWLLANPDKPLTQCAKDLGYTLPWLSCVIHSQAFQAELRARQLLLYGDEALEIKDKLTGVAHLALDKIIESIPAATPDFALDASKEALKALGYSAPRHNQPPSQTNIQLNVGAGVSPDELQRARQAMMTARQAAPAPTLQHDAPDSSGTPRLDSIHGGSGAAPDGTPPAPKEEKNE